MTDEQKAAYVHAQATAAFIECQGMMALNASRERRGEAQGYTEQEFMDLLERYSLFSNHLMDFFHR